MKSRSRNRAAAKPARRAAEKKSTRSPAPRPQPTKSTRPSKPTKPSKQVTPTPPPAPAAPTALRGKPRPARTDKTTARAAAKHTRTAEAERRAQLPGKAPVRVAAKPAPRTNARPATKVARLTERDVRELGERLRAEYERLALLLGKLDMRTQRESSGDLSAYSIHMADLGTDAGEREKDLQIVSAEGRQQERIREALVKIEAGTYGECESCGQPIDRRRLEVVPHAAFCLPCQERLERR